MRHKIIWVVLDSTSRRAFLRRSFAAAMAGRQSDRSLMQKRSVLLFAGTYTTDTRSQGIYALVMDPRSGEYDPPRCVAPAPNPSYLCVDHASRTLYAVEETTGNSGQEGAVWAYRVTDARGSLRALNRVGSRGVGPCFLSLDKRRRTLLVANFHSGSVTSLRLKPDGSLGEVASPVQFTGHSVHPQRQSSSHPHAVIFSPDEAHVVVPDLGADRLRVLDFDAGTGRLSPDEACSVTFGPGSGPRHMALHPNGKFLYVIHEIASVVTVHRWGGGRILSDPLQAISTHARGLDGIMDAADIVIARDGDFLFTSTRRTSTLRSFAVDPENGCLTQVADISSGGQSPHALTLVGESLLIAANLGSEELSLFRRSPGGLLHPMSGIIVPTPAFATPFG